MARARSSTEPAGNSQPFSPEIMEACYKAANEVYVDTSAKNPLFKKLLDSITAYRTDSYTWLQVADMTFDAFQVRMRSRA